jgi:transcriptional regulator with XRE-family HTH domain
MFFEFDLNEKDRASGRFIGAVRKSLLAAAVSEKKNSKVTQQTIAKKLGVNRSVINRMLKGETNLTLRSLAEIAWALGYEIVFGLRKKGAVSPVKQASTESKGAHFIGTNRQTSASIQSFDKIYRDAA